MACHGVWSTDPSPLPPPSPIRPALFPVSTCFPSGQQKVIQDKRVLASKGPAAAAVFQKWEAKKTTPASHARQVRDLQQAQAAGLAQAEAAVAAGAKSKAPISRAQRRATERALDKERTKADKASQPQAADQLLENALKQPAVKFEKAAPAEAAAKPTGRPLPNTQPSPAKIPGKIPAKVPGKVPGKVPTKAPANAVAGRAVNAVAPTSPIPAAAATTVAAVTAANTTAGSTPTTAVRECSAVLSRISQATARAFSTAAAAAAAGSPADIASAAGSPADIASGAGFAASKTATKSSFFGAVTASSVASATAAAGASVYSPTERNCPPCPPSDGGEWLWPAMVTGCAKLIGTHAGGTTGRLTNGTKRTTLGEKGHAGKPSAVGAGGASVGRANRALEPVETAPQDQLGWIGCASPVLPSAPMSNWKRRRDPEAWQKMVSAAILRWVRGRGGFRHGFVSLVVFFLMNEGRKIDLFRLGGRGCL